MGNGMARNQAEICSVTRSKAEAKASYDRLSRWYDTLAGWSEKKARGIGLKKLGVVDGERILEIGCGTGHCMQALAQSVGLTGKAYGIDLSDGMLRITQQRLIRTGLTDRTELKVGDATKLPFDSHSMDGVFTSFTLELFDTPEIPSVLLECKRVLKPGGRVCVVALSRKRDTWRTNAYEWLHEKLPNYVDCRPIFVQKSLEAAGFQVYDATDLPLWGLLCEIVLAKKP